MAVLWVGISLWNSRQGAYNLPTLGFPNQKPGLGPVSTPCGCWDVWEHSSLEEFRRVFTPNLCCK